MNRRRDSTRSLDKTSGRSSKASSKAATSVLLTTQYLEEADRLCKQLVVLDHGKIIAEGTSSQLKSSLGNTVLVLTFASTGDAQQTLGLITDISAKPANVDGTVIELTVDKGPASAAEALRRIDSSEVVLGGLQLREPSLDDVFLNLTGHKAGGRRPRRRRKAVATRARKAKAKV